MTLETPIQSKPNLCARCIVKNNLAIRGIDYVPAWQTGLSCDMCGERPS